MKYVVLNGNLLDEIVLYGNLLDELPMIRNLCVKYVRIIVVAIKSKGGDCWQYDAMCCP